MSENTIELPIVKPKRSYTRKPKSQVEPLITSSGGDPLSTTISLDEPQCDEVPTKPKRSYSRKSKCVEPPTLSLDEPQLLEIPKLVRQTNIIVDTQLIESPPTSPKCVEPHETPKKPRTEKQIAAFAKMRDARIAKQAELNRLKDLEKEEKKLDSEKSKLDKVTEQVINKATEIKNKRASRKKVVNEPVEDFREPQQMYIKEKNIKPILFV